jgi:hypothetical protein
LYDESFLQNQKRQYVFGREILRGFLMIKRHDAFADERQLHFCPIQSSRLGEVLLTLITPLVAGDDFAILMG